MNPMHLFRRLRALFHRRKFEAEMLQELRTHVELRAQQNIEEGMTPADAWSAARRQFGWTDTIIEQCRDQRGGRWLEYFLQDIRFGTRQLFKCRGFSVAAMLTLALGIGANTAMFSLIDGVLLKPLPYPHPGQLLALFENNRAQGQDLVPLDAPSFKDWRSQNSVFEDIAAYQGRGFDLTGVGEATRVLGVRVSTGLFEMLHVNPLLGRLFASDEDAFGRGRVVVLSHRLWQDRFGSSTNVLGQKVTLDGNSYSIIGVMPPRFRFAEIDADFWVPMAFEQFELDGRGAHNYACLARLKPGKTVGQARTELNAIAGRLGRQFPESKGWGASVVPLQEQQVGSSRKPLLILFTAVGFVLLIACANVANLLLVHAAKREREFAVRKALGATRARIASQLIFESLLLSAGGAVLGSLIALWAVGAVVKSGTLPRIDNIRIDATVLGFTAGIALLTSFIFGVAPAWLASHAHPSEVLKEAGRGSTQGRRRWFNSGFVTIQLALAVILLIGASLMLRSFARIRATDLGYKPKGILTAAFSMSDARFPGGEEQRKAFVARIVERVAGLPGVEAAASVMGLPLAFGGARSLVYVEGRADPKPDEPQVSGYAQITTNYFQTMGTPLMRGRYFDGHDTVNAPFVAIVNEAFVRTFFPQQEALGKRLKVFDSHRDQSTEIVGVVRDFRQRDLALPPGPEMYFPVMQRCWFDTQLVVRTQGDPALMTAALRQAVSEVDPLQTLYAVKPLEGVVEGVLSNRKLQLTLLGAFAGIALLLSIVGIYGVVAYLTTQRTHEIGVRMSLGAGKHHILGMLLREGIILVLIGIVCGVGGALALTRILRSLLFEISPTDPETFVLIPICLALVALVACWLPARRAAQVDPMIALRTE